MRYPADVSFGREDELDYVRGVGVEMLRRRCGHIVLCRG